MVSHPSELFGDSNRLIPRSYFFVLSPIAYSKLGRSELVANAQMVQLDVFCRFLLPSLVHNQVFLAIIEFMHFHSI